MPPAPRTRARHARRLTGRPAGGGHLGKDFSFGKDFVASLVVFLVAVPLCIGVAAASGVPPALGIVTGIVGGLIVGLLPGSSLQVSGPAAGLAALVLEFVTTHGIGLLGPVVLAAGLCQIVLGLLRAGRLFQSISVSVVQGMLAGIGIPLLLGQTYALMDTPQLGAALDNLAGLPHLLVEAGHDPVRTNAFLIGTLTVFLCFCWKNVPGPLGKVPAPLVAVVLGSAIAALFDLDVKRVAFGNPLEAVDPPTPEHFAELAAPDVIGMVVTFAVIASAESLFSAAAVDRMHTGPRTRYNVELISQGAGNTLCGLLGALPMTAVIARSAANVHAGARTKASRVLHGAWLLGFGLLLPGLLGLIPMSVLAGILFHAGWKLFDPGAFRKMWRSDRAEGVIMTVTTLVIVTTNLLEGVLAGLAVAIALTALRVSRMTTRKSSEGDTVRLEMRGSATFLRLPRLIEALESVERERKVHLDLTGVHHLDLACRRQVEEWARQRLTTGSVEVRVLMPTAAGEPDAPAAVAGTTRNAALPEAVASVSRPESPPGSESP